MTEKSKKYQDSKVNPLLEAYLEHRDVLAGYLARKLLSKEDIEDVLQETFFQAFQVNARRKILSPKSYLFIVARNLMKRRFLNSAARVRQEISGVELETIEAKQASVDDEVHYKLKLETLKEAVGSLPPQCRKVFILRKFHGYSQKKIAAELGISSSTVERHITIALTRLNSIMLEQGYSTSNPHTSKVIEVKSDKFLGRTK